MVRGQFRPRRRAARPSSRLPDSRAVIVVLAVLATAAAAPVRAWQEPPPDEGAYHGAGIHITDGSYIMNVGQVQMHLTNWGLIGSAPGSPAAYADKPSCQWPAGSGIEHLYTARLLVGARMLGETVVSQGGLASEWRPRDELEATLYEARNQQIIRPPGNTAAGGARAPMPNPDDDDDGRVDEEVLDGHDDDGDGRIDEDFGQIGTQMMVCTMYDNTLYAQERFPDHTPMNLKVVQTAVAWDTDQADDFIGFDYTVTNVGVVELEQVYIGIYADGDVGPRSENSYYTDDLTGSYRGMVRSPDGGWVPIEVGYTYDAAESGRVDDYFGILFLGHDIDPTGRTAPQSVGLRTFQSFQGNAAFEQGGDPTNDAQLYQLMSAAPEDWDADANRPADFRMLVSAGPFRSLAPDESLTFQVAMVCGHGRGDPEAMTGLLGNCMEAWLTWHGAWANDLGSVATYSGRVFDPGQRGRETMLCREDFGDDGPDNPFNTFIPDYMDTTCLDPLWALNQPGLQDDDLFNHDGKVCAMFNLDNCFECARSVGRECTTADFRDHVWTCGDSTATSTVGCTGINGLDTQIHWLVGMAPPPPGVRLWPRDAAMHVFWDDRSEHSPDVRLQKIDFESYRVWRADNWARPFGSSLEGGPESDLWQLVAEYDLVNDYVTTSVRGGVAVTDTMPLGRNTGLEEIRYRPRVLDDPAYAGLEAAMQAIVDADTRGLLRESPQLRDSDGRPDPAYLSLLPWETEPDVLDTFFAVAARPADPDDPDVVAKRSTTYYEYLDRDVHNGFLYFYAVTATDHLLPAGADTPDALTPQGPGLAGNPGTSFTWGTPAAAAQTAEERSRRGANIYVYPNPATRDALREFQQMDPVGDDPTGVRVVFANLPAARNTIRIYTVAGDLVRELQHDGTGGVGAASWNLMSRNAQEIVSGVYLYSVQSDDNRFGDFVGKFVVVR